MRAWRLFPQQGKKQYVVKLGDCYYENDDEEEGSEVKCICFQIDVFAWPASVRSAVVTCAITPFLQIRQL